MKTIAVVDGVPVEPFPDNAIARHFNGMEWTIYEPGDTVPAEGDAVAVAKVHDE